jgi:protoporphyrinogen oxidase
MSNRPILILGAGVSGLAAARRLQDRGMPFALLEKCPTPGGLTRTVTAGNFRFDYSGHFLHLAHFKSIEDIPYAGLDARDWHEVERKAWCLVGGTLVRAPIQYHLSDLPKDEFERCVASYEKRPALGTLKGSFRDVLISGFGERLSDLFLIPQNEKTQAISLDRLSSDALRRFIPNPDEARIRAGILGAGDSSGYNARFWYPTNKGIEALVLGLMRGLSVQTRTEITTIDTAGRVARTRDGRVFPYDSIISSIPLRTLCKIITDTELNAMGSELSNSATIVWNIGIDGPLPEKLKDAHWVYVPSRETSYYRIGCYSNISPSMATPCCHSLYVEAGVPHEEIDTADSSGILLERVISECEEMFALDRKRVRFFAKQVIECAYAHLTPARDKVFPEILNRLSRFGIIPIGRYGLWDYCGMEDSMISGIRAASDVG